MQKKIRYSSKDVDSLGNGKNWMLADIFKCRSFFRSGITNCYAKKPHTIGETSAKTCVLKMITLILVKISTKKIKQMSLDDDPTKGAFQLCQLT